MAKMVVQGVSADTLPIGTITLDVPYNPHWSNLKTWLRLFHEGKVPPLSSKDIPYGLGWKDLHQIVGLFLAVQRDKGGKWEDERLYWRKELLPGLVP